MEEKQNISHTPAPHSLRGISAPEAERNLLSALIQNPLAIDSLPGLSAMDFYLPYNKEICMAILRLRSLEIKIDRVTLNEQIQKNEGQVTQEMINEICDDQVPLGIHEDYYRLLREKTTLRNVVNFCGDQARAAYEFGIGDDLDTFMEDLESKVMRFRKSRSGLVTMKDGRAVLKEAADKFRAAMDSPDPIVHGLMTGITEIDNHTAGMKGGELIIVAARPSCGKTALMMHFCLYASLRVKEPVGVFSLETPAVDLMERAASTLSKVGTMAVKRCQVDAHERELWLRAYEQVEEGLITIDDSSDMTIEDIRARARRMFREKNLKLICIDYLQLVKTSSENKFATRDEKIGKISNGAKQMAKELGIPVILLAQLNRECEKREDKKPRQSDLRDSGQIEQDADEIWGIYRKHGNDSDSFDIISLKGRNTGLFPDVELLFDGETQTLKSYLDQQPDLL